MQDCPSLGASLEPLINCWHVASLSLFYGLDFHLNWLHFLILGGDLHVILIDCLIFLSPFIDVTRMPMSTISLLAQLEFSASRILYLQNAFLCPVIQMALSLELTDIYCRFFLNRCPVYVNLFVLLFLATLCLVVAVQPCMEWIPIKKVSFYFLVIIFRKDLLMKI